MARLIWDVPVKKKETELEKAVQERLKRINKQISLVDKLNDKLMNFFK